MPEERDRLSDWFVERLVANDLSPRAAAQVRARLEAAGELDRLRKLEDSNVAVLAEYPPADVAAEVHRRRQQRAHLAPKRGRTLSPFALRVCAVGSAAALAALIMMRWSPTPTVGIGALPSDPGRETAMETARVKGLSPYLHVYRKTPGGSDRLSASTLVHAGDTLQVAYVAAGRRFGVVASVDTLGTVTLHLPERPGAAPSLVGQGETPLSHAFELDDAPGFERFVFVTADRPFSTDEVAASLSPGGPSLASDLTATDVTLQKAAP